jgi:hypothetical protein
MSQGDIREGGLRVMIRMGIGRGIVGKGGGVGVIIEEGGGWRRTDSLLGG